MKANSAKKKVEKRNNAIFLFLLVQLVLLFLLSYLLLNRKNISGEKSNAQNNVDQNQTTEEICLSYTDESSCKSSGNGCDWYNKSSNGACCNKSGISWQVSCPTSDCIDNSMQNEQTCKSTVGCRWYKDQVRNTSCCNSSGFIYDSPCYRVNGGDTQPEGESCQKIESEQSCWYAGCKWFNDGPKAPCCDQGYNIDKFASCAWDVYSGCKDIDRQDVCQGYSPSCEWYSKTDIVGGPCCNTKGENEKNVCNWKIDECIKSDTKNECLDNGCKWYGDTIPGGSCCNLIGTTYNKACAYNLKNNCEEVTNSDTCNAAGCSWYDSNVTGGPCCAKKGTTNDKACSKDLPITVTKPTTKPASPIVKNLPVTQNCNTFSIPETCEKSGCAWFNSNVANGPCCAKKGTSNNQACKAKNDVPSNYPEATVKICNSIASLDICEKSGCTWYGKNIENGPCCSIGGADSDEICPQVPVSSTVNSQICDNETSFFSKLICKIKSLFL